MIHLLAQEATEVAGCSLARQRVDCACVERGARMIHLLAQEATEVAEL